MKGGGDHCNGGDVGGGGGGGDGVQGRGGEREKKKKISLICWGYIRHSPVVEYCNHDP